MRVKQISKPEYMFEFTQIEAQAIMLLIGGMSHQDMTDAIEENIDPVEDSVEYAQLCYKIYVQVSNAFEEEIQS